MEKHTYTSCIWQDTITGKYAKFSSKTTHVGTQFNFELVTNLMEATRSYYIPPRYIPNDVSLIRRGIEITECISLFD